MFKYLICPLGVLHLFLGPNEFSLKRKKNEYFISVEQKQVSNVANFSTAIKETVSRNFSSTQTDPGVDSTLCNTARNQQIFMNSLAKRKEIQKFF
jgi:hypothetical protein